MTATTLCTAADVKSYLSITVTSDDTLITGLCAAVSEAAKQYLNRDIGSISYTETYDGNGKQRQMVNYYPVTAVGALSVDDVVKSPAGLPLTSSVGYRFDRYSVILNTECFTKGIQNVVITYTAGLAVIPGDVKQAAVSWVASLYRLKDRIGESSKGLPSGGQTNYALRNIPIEVQQLLQTYRKMSPLL